MENNLIPADYAYINVYNASRSPSTVHVKNTRLRNYFRKYLLQKAMSVFKWTLPEEWDKDYFLYTLYGMGFISVLNTDKIQSFKVSPISGITLYTLSFPYQLIGI